MTQFIENIPGREVHKDRRQMTGCQEAEEEERRE